MRQRWAIDFIHDTLADGRPFRVLSVVDVFSRSSEVLEGGFSFTGARVAELLEKAAKDIPVACGRQGRLSGARVDHDPAATPASDTRRGGSAKRRTVDLNQGAAEGRVSERGSVREPGRCQA